MNNLLTVSFFFSFFFLFSALSSFRLCLCRSFWIFFFLCHMTCCLNSIGSSFLLV